MLSLQVERFFCELPDAMVVLITDILCCTLGKQVFFNNSVVY